MFKKEVEIPIEILVYNMINFIPSPINFELELNVFPEKGSKYLNSAAGANETSISYSNNATTNYNNTNFTSKTISNIKDQINSSSYSNNNKNRTNSIVSKNSTNSAGSNHNNCSPINTTNHNTKRFWNVQFIISLLGLIKNKRRAATGIFNWLIIIIWIKHKQSVIEVFVMLLMEIDVIFFSKNLEILNPAMYILSKLTFPCDDSMYQWNIVTVSKAEFSTDNIFTGKPGTLMVGVNCTYDNTIETIRVRGNNIVVDLDNKKIEFITTSQEEYDQMNNFRKFLRQCIFPQTNYNYLYFNQNTNSGYSFFYKEFLSKLYGDLFYILNRKASNIPQQNGSSNNNYSSSSNSNNTSNYSANDRSTIVNNNTNSNSNSITNNNAGGNINYFFLLNNINSNSNSHLTEGNSSQLDFFDYKEIERIYKYNKEIQEIFFNFMIKLLTVFYNFFKLKSISEKNIDISDEKNSFFIKCSDKLNDNDFYEGKFNAFNEHEKFFFNNFISTKRYDKYFLGYIVKNEVNKMHRMAYQFSEEYIYIQKTASVDLNHSIYQGKIKMINIF